VPHPHTAGRFVSWASRRAALAALILAILGALAGTAVAQTPSRVRVTTDQTIIWRPGFLSQAEIVKAGTELDVVSHQGNWYEVVLPSNVAPDRQLGFIAASRVEVIAGSALKPPITSVVTQPGPGKLTKEALRARPGRTGFQGFAQGGYNRFTAEESFAAVFGRADGVFFGGGGEFRGRNGTFVQGAVQIFRRTGERAFVLDGTVLPTGIPETITIVPIEFTVGYRRFGRGGAAPYVGGGLGLQLYTEVSPLLDPSEEVDDQFTSYHVLGGVEWRSGRWLGTAVEAQYTHVPNALTGGLAADLDERNLGGVQVRFKLLMGR
jgi:hypothetical protein